MIWWVFVHTPILLMNLCFSCSKLIAIRTPNPARKALDRLLVPNLTQCLLHSRLLIREGMASVKCQMPPYCPLGCSSLGTQEPSALGAHIQLKSSPVSHASFSSPRVEPSLCLPPALSLAPRCLSTQGPLAPHSLSSSLSIHCHMFCSTKVLTSMGF